MAKNTHTAYDRDDLAALKASNLPAALQTMAHFDSAEDASVFFARELDFVKAQSYDAEYPELTALTLFPISHEADPGAETITYYSYDKAGQAKIISNYSNDPCYDQVSGCFLRLLCPGNACFQARRQVPRRP